jgi:hypothetical protein
LPAKFGQHDFGYFGGHLGEQRLGERRYQTTCDFGLMQNRHPADWKMAGRKHSLAPRLGFAKQPSQIGPPQLFCAVDH